MAGAYSRAYKFWPCELVSAAFHWEFAEALARPRAYTTPSKKFFCFQSASWGPADVGELAHGYPRPPTSLVGEQRFVFDVAGPQLRYARRHLRTLLYAPTRH
jgi:hypothetical protein